jgi:glycosyltransferase involved in cell wall biosynthesis
MENEDFRAAETLLRAERAAGHGSWLVKNDLALCLFMSAEAEAALSLLQEVLDQEPANSFALINRFYLQEASQVCRAQTPEPRTKIKFIQGEGPAEPLITVVMPTYNRPGLISESVESVMAQTMPRWELIVVNDGGGREVEATLQTFLQDRRVRYVLAEHGGLSSARNVGMALARGRFITQLDDDDIYYPEHLAVVAEAFATDPARRVVYTDFYRAYQEERQGKWVTVRRRLDYSRDFTRTALRTGTIAPVCNLTHHREALDTVGYYNENILRAMDWEYFIRLARRYDFAHVPRVTGEFRQRSDRSQMTRSFGIPRNYYRNLVSYLHGFFPLTGARFLYPGLGRGERLKAGLDNLMAHDEEGFFLKRLELRKLLVEPSYALFYTLGKRLAEEGYPRQSRQAFRTAARLRPYEIKTWLKCFKP